jgi:transcriptional regulator with XRE-family HTH domain
MLARNHKRLHSTNLWNTIDKIAAKKGVTLPVLALQAGLDQSTFSPARRKRNWMSLQTLAMVLNATGISPTEWAKMIDLNERDTYCPPSKPQIGDLTVAP